MATFRYDTIKKFLFQELTPLQVDALRLPDVALRIDSAIDPTLHAFRSMQHLDRFRHPGFPDDVAAIYGNDCPPFCGEQLWVRVDHAYDSVSFAGALLNQPGMHAGAKGRSRCSSLHCY